MLTMFLQIHKTVQNWIQDFIIMYILCSNSLINNVLLLLSKYSPKETPVRTI